VLLAKERATFRQLAAATPAPDMEARFCRSAWLTAAAYCTPWPASGLSPCSSW